MLTILCGDALEQLRTLESESVQCCVSSPPYWGLRDYGVAGQLGMEKAPEEFVTKLVAIFEEVRRLLRSDGTCWVNLGDSYANDGKWGGSSGGKHVEALHGNTGIGRQKVTTGLKPKDLVGIPWRFAFAAQAAGWFLRSEIIWHKPNPMPESVTDRPTKAHEQIFLFTKSQRYFYDAEAIKEPVTQSSIARLSQDVESQRGSDRVPGKTNGTMKAVGRGGVNAFRGQGSNRDGVNGSANRDGRDMKDIGTDPTRNKRTVWTVPTQPYREAHFATFPPDLIKPCILAGSRHGDVVLDPFAGSGTTGQVALELGRKATLIELNPEYVKLIEQRCHVTPGLAL